MRLLGWKYFIVHFVACLMSVVALGGCAEMDVTNNLTNNIPWIADPKPVVPNRVTAMWTPTILNQTGKTGVRGFGGRVFFHSDSETLSVKVEGMLTVYAFEENGRDPGHTRPARKYVFLKEQVPDHYDKTKLGHSYSFWLPWDEVGGPPKHISLMARFDPSDGSSAVISESAAQVLPGIQTDLIEKESRTDVVALKKVTTEKKGPRDRSRKLPIRTASYEDVDENELQSRVDHASYDDGKLPELTTEKASMSTITIDVPVGFARRTFAGSNASEEVGVDFIGVESDIEAESTGSAIDVGRSAADDVDSSSELGTTGRQAAGRDSKSMATGRAMNTRRAAATRGFRRRIPRISESRSLPGEDRSERSAGRLSVSDQRQARFERPRFPVRAGRELRPTFGRGWREPSLEAGPSAERQ